MENNEFWDFFLRSVEIPITFRKEIRLSLQNGGKISPELDEWLSQEEVKSLIAYVYDSFKRRELNGDNTSNG